MSKQVEIKGDTLIVHTRENYESVKKVIFEYKEKRGTKMTFGKITYYIKHEDQILGIIEDEEC